MMLQLALIIFLVIGTYHIWNIIWSIASWPIEWNMERSKCWWRQIWCSSHNNQAMKLKLFYIYINKKWNIFLIKTKSRPKFLYSIISNFQRQKRIYKNMKHYVIALSFAWRVTSFPIVKMASFWVVKNLAENLMKAFLRFLGCFV